MIIGFDIDGVLHHWHRDVYDYFIREREYKDTYHNFWTKYIPTIQGTTLMRNIVLDPTMYTHRSIKTEYLSILEKFDRAGWKIWYISSVSGDIARDRTKWYKANNLPQCENYKFVDGISKKSAVKEVECDYFVEDRVETIVDLLGHTFVFVVDQPWNERLGNGSALVIHGDIVGEFLKIPDITYLPNYLLGG